MLTCTEQICISICEAKRVLGQFRLFGLAGLEEMRDKNIVTALSNSNVKNIHQKS